MITRYVDTGAAPGGDGTTAALVGANCAYDSLSAGEVANRAASHADDLEFLCNGAAADAVPVVFGNNDYVGVGFTVFVAANVGAAEGFHGGAYNVGTYRIDCAGACIKVNAAFDGRIVIRGIQHVVGIAGESGIVIDAPTLAGSAVLECVCRASVAGAYGISVFPAAANLLVQNTLIGNRQGPFPLPTTHGVNVLNGHVDVRNCVIDGWACGVIRAAGVVTVSNSAVFDNATDFFGGMTVTSCASDDGTGVDPVFVASWADQFYNSMGYTAGQDYRIVGTSVLRGVGVGPAVDPLVPVVDIVGVARAGAICTVGPFEGWMFVPLVPRRWAQPYNGLVQSVHLPAKVWCPPVHVDMNPNPAALWSNDFGPTEYDHVDGWCFSHPSLIGETINYSCVDTEIILPDWVRNRLMLGEGSQIGIEFSYLTTGDAGGDTIWHFVAAKFCPFGVGLLTASPWQRVAAHDVVGPPANMYMVSGAHTIFFPPGFPGFEYGPNRVLRLRVGRECIPGGAVEEETWAFETIFTGATVYFKSC